MATPGALLRQALRASKPLQIVGAVNAYTAQQAQQLGKQPSQLAITRRTTMELLLAYFPC